MQLVIRHMYSLSNAFFRSSGSSWDSDFHHKDPCLHDAGRAQGVEVARFIDGLKDNGKPIKNVICSPLLRCIESAGVVLDALNYRGVVRLDPVFRERRSWSISDEGTERSVLLDFLNSAGSPLARQEVDTSALVDEVWYDTDAESELDFKERVSDAQKLLQADNRAGRNQSLTLVFTHCGLIQKLCKMHAVNGQVIHYAAQAGGPKTLFRPQITRRAPEGFAPPPRSFAFSYLAYLDMMQQQQREDQRVRRNGVKSLAPHFANGLLLG